jgi:uncharacterized protein DUF4202
MSRLDDAFAKIDAANAEDPTLISVEGVERPAELVYGERMSETLASLYPEASEALKLAIRAQHIRRWTVPRSSYPMDRVGYLRWRKDLQKKHAEWTGAIMAECGYSEADIARVSSLIKKENLKRDAEAQALEDVAAIVFLEHYAVPFAAKHEPAKVKEILAKTMNKMSDYGREAALRVDLPPAVASLVREIASAPATTSEPAP